LLSKVVAAPCFLGVVNLGEQSLCELDMVQEKVDEWSIGFGKLNIIVQLELCSIKGDRRKRKKKKISPSMF
jgi:hypothetical protein